MLMWNLQRFLAQLVLALLPVLVCSTLHYEHGYAPAHEYKEQDYSFSYGVKDLHSGDVKQQWEKKVGGVVTGSYSLIEPDGRVRIVDYSADKESGFTATVKHKGVAKHPEGKLHPYAHLPGHESQKPISHTEFNLKPGVPTVHYPHRIPTTQTNPYDHIPAVNHQYQQPETKYEIKYLYPSEIKKHEEALAAQQYGTEEYARSVSAAAEVQEEPEEDGHEQSESQNKHIHFYVPETKDSKSEGNTNVPSAYLDTSETEIRSQIIPLDFNYVKQSGHPPGGVELRDSYGNLFNQQQPGIPINKLNKGEVSGNILKEVYTAIKDGYKFSPPPLENGFQPLGRKEKEEEVRKLTATPGLGQYASQQVKETPKYKYSPPTKGNKYEFLPSYYQHVKNLQTQALLRSSKDQEKGFKSRSSSQSRSSSRSSSKSRNVKGKH